MIDEYNKLFLCCSEGTAKYTVPKYMIMYRRDFDNSMPSRRDGTLSRRDSIFDNCHLGMLYVNDVIFLTKILTVRLTSSVKVTIYIHQK